MSRIPPKPSGSGGSGNVQRRVVGSAPELGKVSRVVTEPRRRRKRKRGGPGDSGSKNDPKQRGRRRKKRGSKVLTHWLILILSGAGLIFGGGVIWSILSQDNLQSPGIITTAADDLPSLNSATALKMSERFLNAEGPADLEGILRSGAMSPQQAFEYIRDTREEGGRHKNLVWIGTVDSMSIPIEFVSVNYLTGPNRTILFVQESDGEWKIDFEAFARHCVPDIRRLIDPAHGEGVARVNVSRDNYYNDLFADDNEWACYLLTHPDSPVNLYGYCKRGTRVHWAMQAIEARVYYHTDKKARSYRPLHKRQSRATLRIARPAGAEIRQFEILDVLADDWVLTDTPFDILLEEKLENLSQS